MMRILRTLGFAALASLGCGAALADPTPSDVDLSAVTTVITQSLSTPVGPVIDGDALDGVRLRAVYEPRAHAALWTGPRGDVLARVLADAGTEGLDPGPYHVAAVAARAATNDPARMAERDLLLSDGLLHYAADVHAGRSVPRSRGAQVDLEPRSIDGVQVVDVAAGATDLEAFLAELPPRNPEYARLRQLLARYRQLEADGGWPLLPEGLKLEPGGSNPAVPVLRRRLAATGDLEPSPDPSPRYDEDLLAAVERFQRRHGLVPDGVVGGATRAALNVDVGSRIGQIVANLERWRWFPDNLGERHVEVSIADFTLTFVEQGRRTLAMPVVVGRRDRMTPIVSSHITRLTFNPTWTVPETIARKDMLTKVRRDAAFFGNAGIRVYARGGAHYEIDPATVNWEESGIMGYLLRQPPGPRNPLGRVRFDFPNANAVYLHDSPKRRLFSQPMRAQSSGCVRVGQALDLADHLLAGTPGWSDERRASVLASWRTREVALASPIPVHIVYRTAWLDDAGVAQFRDDLYGRDRQLAQALTKKRSAPGERARGALSDRSARRQPTVEKERFSWWKRLETESPRRPVGERSSDWEGRPPP